MFHAGSTVSRVCLQNDFGIAPRAERCACDRERLPKLAVVVDFAIERDPIPGLGIAHRLGTRGRESNDLEPPMHETHRVFPILREYLHSPIVWTTVRERRRG